jgi:ankyrin repeat protein
MRSFLDAIWDGDVEAVRESLQNDPRLANSIQKELPPLHWACRPANPEIVSKLLEFGADPNSSTEDGETPLHIAAYEGSDACVQLLLDSGADVSATTEDGKTPLMSAAQTGLSIVRSLLAAGADPLSRDSGGRTALHWAIIGTHDDGSLIRLLLSGGADPQAMNLNGDTPVDYARAMNKPVIERELAGK